MYLSHLSLVNFKNSSEASFNFSEKVNCFLGNNGEGKTNLLDAIYYLSNCKSHFNGIDSQNIKFEEPFFVIQGEFEMEDGLEKIYCGVKRGQKKTFKRNQKVYKKLSDHIGLMPVVIITPYDSNLILEGSDIRRKFLDVMISQFDKSYLENLVQYNKTLQHRNALLKQFQERGTFQQELLEILDEQLIDKGEKIYEKRKSFLEDFIPVFNQYYHEISQGNENVELRYLTDLHETDFAVLLKDSLQKDRVSTYTGKGIHKDDLEFVISDHPIKKFGSQGQQKSFLIALKLAKYNYIKNQKGFSPILLLDDIFDKLDDNRVGYLLSSIENNNLGQTFITDTSLTKVPELLDKARVDYRAYSIANGSAVELEMEES